MVPTPPEYRLYTQNIPDEMWARRQWVVWNWKYDEDKQKFTKVPHNPNAPKYLASSKNPDHWGSLDTAIKATRAGSADGVGFVFTEGDGMTFIDLDHCRDVETGALAPHAQEIVDRFASYTEVSVSGDGLHIFCFAELPGKGRKSGNVEMYDRRRFATVTGNLLAPTLDEIRPAHEHADTFYREWFGDPSDSPIVGDYAFDDDATVLDLEDLSQFNTDDCDWVALIRDGDGIDRYDGDHSNAVHHVCQYLVSKGVNKETLITHLTDPANYLADQGPLSTTRADGNIERGRAWLWDYCVGPELALHNRSVDDLQREPADAFEVVDETPAWDAPDLTKALDADGNCLVNPRPWIMEDVLMAGTSGMLAGNPGTGKSTLALQIAVSIAVNQNLTTIEREPLRRSGPVFYVNAEESTDELVRRLLAIHKHFGLDWDLICKNLHLVSGAADRIELARLEEVKAAGWNPTSKGTTWEVVPGEHMERLFSDVERCGGIALILDPSIEFRTGINENDNSQMGQMMALIRAKAVALQIGVYHIHHVHKSGSTNTEAHSGDVNFARGASAQAGNVRTSSTLCGMSDKHARDLNLNDTEQKSMVVWEGAKNNSGARSARSLLRLTAVSLGNPSDPDPEDRVAVLVPQSEEDLRQQAAERAAAIEEASEEIPAEVKQDVIQTAAEYMHDHGMVECSLGGLSNVLSIRRRPSGAPRYSDRHYRRLIPDVLQDPGYHMIDGTSFKLALLVVDDSGKERSKTSILMTPEEDSHAS